MRAVLALPCLFLLAPPLTAAEVNRSWETLQQTVITGKKVVVTRMNSARVEGKLLSIDAAQVTIEMKKQPVKVERADVFRLRYADIRRRNTLIGLGAGAAVLGALAGIGAGSPAVGIIAAGTGGVGIGAASGAAIPIGKPLYESEKSPPKGERK